MRIELYYQDLMPKYRISQTLPLSKIKFHMLKRKVREILFIAGEATFYSDNQESSIIIRPDPSLMAPKKRRTITRQVRKETKAKYSEGWVRSVFWARNGKEKDEIYLTDKNEICRKVAGFMQVSLIIEYKSWKEWDATDQKKREIPR